MPIKLVQQHVQNNTSTPLEFFLLIRKPVTDHIHKLYLQLDESRVKKQGLVLSSDCNID